MCEVLDSVGTMDIAHSIPIGEAKDFENDFERGFAIGFEIGFVRGFERGQAKKAREVALNLHNMGMSPADIAEVVNEPLSDVQQWLGDNPA